MKNFIKDFRLYAKIKKQELKDKIDRIENQSWGESYPPNMTDSWARELGIID